MELYNTLTREITALTPLSKPDVRIYTCGLTVYSQPHIGNWTGYIYWDVLVRALDAKGFNVIRTQNITDVGHLVSDDDSGNDKMEVGAKREGLTAWDVAAKYIDIADHEAYMLLGLRRPKHVVRATDCIAEQISFVQVLEEKSLTYVIPGEGIYFDTSRLANYGELARLDITGLQEGARVAVQGKRNATDFAVWKFSPAGSTRDMEWDSPWGTGFPGWHLECSVIARTSLGDQIDIHTGGVDHIPVHHTNEIAQTESVTGLPFSQIWLHNNHLKVDGGKMSKSEGTTYTLQDIQDKGFDLAAFKLLVLAKHYRTEGNFTWAIMEAAQNRWQNWKDIAVLRHQITVASDSANDSSSTDSADTDNSSESADSSKTSDITTTTILDALAKDLDTPAAVVAAEKLLNSYEDSATASTDDLTQLIQTIDKLFGLTLEADTPDIAQDVKDLIRTRQDARDAKDWQKSDQLRDELTTRGIGVRDAALGPIWFRLSRPRP